MARVSKKGFANGLREILAGDISVSIPGYGLGDYEGEDAGFIPVVQAKKSMQQCHDCCSDLK